VIVSTLAKLPETLAGETGPLIVLIGHALADYKADEVADVAAEAAREMRAAD
jgi:hypothetical protein